MIAGPRRAAAGVGVVAFLFAFAACGKSNNKSSSSDTTATTAGATTTSGATGTTAAAASDTITISGFKFSPDTLSVKAGATVTVKNSDSAPHTVTADDGSSFDSSTVSGGSSATFTAPTKAGTYKFHCKIHANMEHKTLVVM